MSKAMMSTLKAPAPYFGGKAAVASLVWELLGDPGHYIEPFFGMGAVLLARRGWEGRTETVNDADGQICNVWRSLQADPDQVARWCDWPVNHADLIARKKRLNEQTGSLTEQLCADDGFCDPKLAGYWIWAASCWIGSGLICPNQIPHIGHAGKGVHAKGQIPHLSDAGMGVHAKRQIPHLSDAGKGVHAKGKRPHLGDAVRGVQEPYNTNLYGWFRALAERLRYVRVVCGDWTRVCGGDWQDKIGTVGLFFDPPYGAEANRAPRLYAADSLTVAGSVRDWCIERGARSSYRIVLAGYYEEHESLLDHGWSVHRWSAQGGYAPAGNGNGNQNRHRESLFASPHCLREELFE